MILHKRVGGCCRRRVVRKKKIKQFQQNNKSTSESVEKTGVPSVYDLLLECDYPFFIRTSFVTFNILTKFNTEINIIK